MEGRAFFGILRVLNGEVTVAWIQNPEPEPTYIRIGKRHSTESRELIAAWLGECAAMKREQGYEEVSREEFDTAYGKANFTLLRRGDQYFTTYLQYDRTRDANDHFYLAYTYHLELGAWSRTGIHKRQRARAKLGN